VYGQCERDKTRVIDALYSQWIGFQSGFRCCITLRTLATTFRVLETTLCCRPALRAREFCSCRRFIECGPCPCEATLADGGHAVSSEFCSRIPLGWGLG